MDMFWLNHEQLLKGVNLGFQRYLSRQVKWDRRLIGIFGAKGVGKTTLLLQRIKLAYGDSHEALYLPLDNIWFQERCMLSETVRQFYEEGGRHLFLDNVHRYGSWVQAIECLHDDYPDMQIVFAAPLLVEGEKTEMPFDGKGDWYTLHTMSFREYLSYEGALDLKPVPLDELLLNHAEVTQQVMDEINIVPIFRNYLEHGCYPFYWEDPDAFNFRLQDLMRDSVDVDLPAIRQMNNAVFRKMKQLLIQLAKEAPEFPRMQVLTSKYEMDNTQMHKLLDYVKEMGVFRILQVRKEDGGLARSYRSFLANTNLMASLFREMERIYWGETFFVDQMSNCGTVELLHNGDYRVNEKYTFVIGDPLMDYTLLQHVVSAYKQLAPEGNVWVYTNAVSLIEYSNEELDFIKNNVNILLILCEENLLRMDSIINVMHKSQIRFEVQSRDLMQEFDESVLCNNTIDFIQKNKLPIVSHLNMKRNVTLYSNTNAGIRNQCYDGRIFISLDGSVGVCKQYLLPLSIINNKSWADIIHQLAKMWKKTFTSPVCENCGLSALCISCQHLHELYLKQSTEFPRAICFTQQSGKNKHRKEEEIHA